MQRFFGDYPKQLIECLFFVAISIVTDAFDISTRDLHNFDCLCAGLQKCSSYLNVEVEY